MSGEKGAGPCATRGGADVSVTFGFPARDGTAARPVGEGGLGGGAATRVRAAKHTKEEVERSDPGLNNLPAPCATCGLNSVLPAPFR